MTFIFLFSFATSRGLYACLTKHLFVCFSAAQWTDFRLTSFGFCLKRRRPCLRTKTRKTGGLNLPPRPSTCSTRWSRWGTRSSLLELLSQDTTNLARESSCGPYTGPPLKWRSSRQCVSKKTTLNSDIAVLLFCFGGGGVWLILN